MKGMSQPSMLLKKLSKEKYNQREVQMRSKATILWMEKLKLILIAQKLWLVNSREPM